jgi:hypothetical protein
MNRRNYAHANLNAIVVRKDGTIGFIASIYDNRDVAVLNQQIAAALAQ